MSDLIFQLREIVKDLVETNSVVASLMFRAANAIEEYREWIEIVKQKSTENYETIEDVKTMLQSITELLKMMAGKY